MLSLDRLIRLYENDHAAIERHLTVSARLVLNRFTSTYTRAGPPPSLTLPWHATEIRWIADHLEAMIKASAITREQADRELADHRRRLAAHLRGTLTPAPGRSLRK